MMESSTLKQPIIISFTKIEEFYLLIGRALTRFVTEQESKMALMRNFKF